MFKIFKSSILAGICIAMGGTVFMKVGDLWGAILFSFGLLTVVHYGLKLYTGTAGFFKPSEPVEWVELIFIIVGNAIGCILFSVLVHQALPDLVPISQAIVEKRLSTGRLNCFLLAICCGFIMTTAVQFGRKNHFLPLLFGVPLFIMCGFTHSIADAFYFINSATAETPITGHLMSLWFGEILGNFVGCNLYRMMYIKTN